ncbi:MAG: hypothetical protein FWF15_12485, partial [Oscillospiraceae bacterium]|nr:hypothetical protein [Oscillospiraceae bacterium]
PKTLRYLWPGDRALTHDRILQRMRGVLTEQTEYPYLGANAVARLREGRRIAAELNLDKYNVIDMENGEIGILPWMGHRNYNTLKKILQHYMPGNKIGGMRTYFMTLKDWEYNMLGKIKTIVNGEVNPNDFIREETIRTEKKNYEYKVPKYDRYVPNVLLKKQVIEDYIDIPAVREQVNEWR